MEEEDECKDEGGAAKVGRTETKFGGSRTYIALCAKAAAKSGSRASQSSLPLTRLPPIKSYANLITRLGSPQEYFTHPCSHLGRRRATPDTATGNNPASCATRVPADILGLSSSNTKITLADILPKPDVLFCLPCLLHTLSLHGSTLSAAPQNLVQSPFKTHVPRRPTSS